MRALRTLPSPAEQDQKLKDVSKMYEKQFLREMVKAMRGTVQESGFIKTNQAEKIFREQLDQEHVEKWGDRGGLGLSDVIYKQLLDKYGAALGIKGPIQKPMGPIPLDEKSNFQGRRVDSGLGASSSSPISSGLGSGDTKQITYQFDRALVPGASAVGEAQEIRAPWAGRLEGAYRLDTGEEVMNLVHDNGLKSRLVFRGQKALENPGLSAIEPGQKLGLLSPDAKAFFWTLEHRPESVSE